MINYPLEDWLDSRELASKLHLSLRTIQRMRLKGVLPYSHLGKKFYYRRQDIEAILNANYTRCTIDFSHGKIIK